MIDEWPWENERGKSARWAGNTWNGWDSFRQGFGDIGRLSEKNFHHGVTEENTKFL
ncbi:MAG: hypothetical protein LBH43_21330 [Treponema sp.]|jgi:hypothetical protein|nr:hypothetical protein [Treponema sp.]